jgi:hypothetical protein
LDLGLNNGVFQENLMPFSEESLNRILKLDNNLIIANEGNNIEFKKAFNLGGKEKYAKTLAAFSNSKGGYLIFGVDDEKHEVLGLSNDKFENMDPATLSRFLNDSFSAEIRWEKYIHNILNRKIGIIYVYEAEEKPILCKKNQGDLKEGDIYYRYNGSSERARFNELKAMLDFEKEKYTKKLMEQISKIVKIGVGNVAIMDTVDGKLYGNKESILLDESLLSKIKFINEGSFNETIGEPTLKVIGSLESVKIITRSKFIPIRTPDIVNAFLAEKVPDNISPLNFIEELPFESSGYLPLYFFAEKAGLFKHQILKIITDSKSTRASKMTLETRLRKENDFYILGKLNANSLEASKRRNFKKSIISRNIDLTKIEDADLKYLIESITHFSENEMAENKTYIFHLFQHIFNNYYGIAHDKFYVDIASTFRYAICHIDYLLYGNHLRY